MVPSNSVPPTIHETTTTTGRSGVVDCRTRGDLVFVTWSWSPHQPTPTAAEVYRTCAGHLAAHGAEVLHERLFCRLESAAEMLAARTRTPAARWPVHPTIIEGRSPLGPQPAGLQLLGCRPHREGKATTVSSRGDLVGIEVTGRQARYLALSDVASALNGSPPTPEAEAEAAILEAARLLAAHGWSPRHIRRTWFYLDDILAWYPGFNAARRRAFATLGLDTGDPAAFLPASTGIAGLGTDGRRCTLDLLAIQGVPGKPFSLRRLRNPLQNEAPEYGSDFSRGLEVTTGDARLALVSGTAAIDTSGRSLAAGDVRRQIACTLDTVAALLADADMAMGDIAQGTAFLKHGEHYAVLGEELARRGLERLPLVTMVADVCRDELLFELDATAVAEGGG